MPMFKVATEHREEVRACLANPGLGPCEVSQLGDHEWLWMQDASDAVFIKFQLPSGALTSLRPSELQ
jgi:hypothetical protein